MRNTLLPKEEKDVLRHEYRIRAFIVFCFAISVAVILGIGALFPSFVKSAYSRRSAEAQVEALKKNNNIDGIETIQEKIKLYQTFLTILDDTNENNSSSFVDKLVSVRGSVRINSISLSYVSTTTIDMSIGGIAPNRESLLSFKSRLADTFSGSTIDLPLSDLAKSTDITFGMKIQIPIK